MSRVALWLVVVPCALAAQQTAPVDSTCGPGAASSIVSGRVLAGDRPSAGVQAALLASRQTTRTNAAGQFRFAGVCAGPGDHRRTACRVRASARGDRGAGRRRTGAEFYAGLAACPAHTTRVDARRVPPLLQDFERRRRTMAGGRFITDSVLRSDERMTLPAFLRARIPGITFVSTAGGVALASRRNAISSIVHGQLPCLTGVYSDGVLIRQPPALDAFQLSDLSAIEFYPGTATTPLEFKSLENSCGVLVLWHRQK